MRVSRFRRLQCRHASLQTDRIQRFGFGGRMPIPLATGFAFIGKEVRHSPSCAAKADAIAAGVGTIANAGAAFDAHGAAG